MFRFYGEGSSDDTIPTFPGELSDSTPNNNADVELVQQRLNILLYYGYNGKKLSEDGGFGNNTIWGVKKLQEKNSLPITGVINENTWNKLFSSNAVNFEGSIGEIPIPNPNTTVTKEFAEFAARRTLNNFEGGWYALSANDDGAGLSIGHIQSNFK